MKVSEINIANLKCQVHECSRRASERRTRRESLYRVLIGVLAPETGIFRHTDVTVHPRLAGEPEPAIGIVWRDRQADALTASGIAHRARDGDGTGPTRAEAVAVDRVRP